MTELELARRLRSARKACRLRQADVARSLGLSPSAIAQLEAGRRAVSSLELDRLAYLYGRSVGDFLAEDFRDEDTLFALFRLHPQLAEDGPALEATRRSFRLGQATSDLAAILGMGRASVAATADRLSSPDTKRVAIRQGEQVAREEWRPFRRHFLALGIEAFRREAISRGKLRELARLVETDDESLEEILEDVGLGPQPVDVDPSGP